jgi:hypothetical protein
MITASPSRLFIEVAGALLIGAAAMTLISAWIGVKLLEPHDPIFGIPMPGFLLLLGVLESVVGLLCFIWKNMAGLAVVVLWLAVNLAVCQAGFGWLGVNGSGRGYFDCVTAAFALPTSLVEGVLRLITAYLLVGSPLVLICCRIERKQALLQASQLASGELLKNSCPACLGHILFSATNLGQKVPCPHCRADVTLRQTDNLKMSCFFCNGHIEFPKYAIGEKVQCPHCKMDITLKEPA